MPKGSLKLEDHHIIKVNYEYLSNEVEVKDILGSCFEKKIIDLDEKEEIESHPSRKKRAEIFLKYLFNSGEGGYQKFLDSLEKDYHHVVVKLKSTTSDEEGKSSGVWLDFIDDKTRHERIKSKDVTRFALCVTDGWKTLLNKLTFNDKEIEEQQMNSLDDIMCLCRCLKIWGERKNGDATVQDLVDKIKEVYSHLTINQERFRQALQMIGE